MAALRRGRCHSGTGGASWFAGVAEPPERPRQAAACEAAASRRERLAEAMRANLKRRKAQQRGREAVGAPDAEPVEEG
jgi:hypothetical protein